MRVAETKHVLVIGAGTFCMPEKLFGCLGWVACNADTRLLLYGGNATSTIPNSVQVNEFADANRIQSNCSK